MGTSGGDERVLFFFFFFPTPIPKISPECFPSVTFVLYFYFSPLVFF